MERFKKLLRGVTATMLAVGLLAGGVTGTANAADNNTYDLWFGDSQMYGHGIKDANTRQAKRFSRLVSDADNATDVNVAVSGTNWTGTTSNRFGSQIDKLIANYSGKNVRRIIGQGVHNDAEEKPSIDAKSTDAELKAKAQTIADTAQPYYTKLRAAFPNAQIAYIPQVTVWGSTQKNNAFFAAVLKMGAYLSDDLKQQGWTVMDMQTDLDLIGDHQDYLADIIHVNEKGHVAAAQGIIKWLDTTDVPVSLDKPSNGGTGGKYLYGTAKPGTATTTATANQFTRTGYTFTGWNTKADGTGTAYQSGAAIAYPAEGKTLTLYAQWKVSSHIVTFDTNGGNAIASQTVDDKGKAKEPTAPTRDSWTFAGWYLNGVEYDFTTPVTQDITLKAGWKRVAPSMEFKDMHKRISAGSKSGQRKLTLDVKGTGETNKSVTPSDVVILVDETNSMRECADGSSKAGSGIQCATGPSKRDNLGNIIDSAVTSILTANAGRSADQQSRISVIRFAGRNSKYPPKALSQFTTDKNVALPNGWNQGDDLYQKGTDWATALEHVGEAGTTRSNVNKQIILVTDGLASAANEDYAKAGTTANAALNIKDSTTLQKAIKAYGYANQRTMTVTQSLAKAGWHLRVVGVSADASATALGDSYLAGAYPYVGKDGSIGLYKKGSQPSGYSSQIEWIASVANNAGDSTAIGSDFEATDINNITSTLTSTVITSTTMRNTVISDPLSEWVDPVGLVDGKGTGITVSKDGKPMDSGYTAVYDGSSRTVKVSLPDSLADGSVYSVSFEVALSDKARSNYMQSGTYPDTGDADTGTTSAGKKGYFTNGNATLSWDAVTSTNGTPLIVSHKAKYAKPVASYDSSNVPPVLTNKLPGTGGVASLMPVFIGAGLALALAAAWIVRKHLARLP